MKAKVILEINGKRHRMVRGRNSIGCCTKCSIEKQHPDIEAIKAIEDHAYFAGSEAMREKITNKACEWLKDNWRKHVWLDGDNIIHFGLWENDFRKAMEGCI